ncbi:MAG: hypothetical protein U0401_28070 [Anaerolineae bacterium]
MERPAVSVDLSTAETFNSTETTLAWHGDIIIPPGSLTCSRRHHPARYSLDLVLPKSATAEIIGGQLGHQ